MVSLRTIYKCLGLCVLAVTAAAAAEQASSYKTLVFPPAHEIFPPLLADPTELKFNFQMGAPVGEAKIAKIGLGDYLGIYRWAFSDQNAFQVNVGGAVNSRFDATPSHRLQVIDYYGNVPIDLAMGPVACRFMFYHVSSHLGDDYLRQQNIAGNDASWEALRGIFSLHPWKAFRFYGGYNHAVHTKPVWDNRDAVQGGMEIYFNNSDLVHWHPYLATDIQSWGRSSWTPTYTSEIGIKTGGQYSQGRGISYFVQFMSGPRIEGQFFDQKETTWMLGLKFQLSQAPAIPAPPSQPLTNP